jgi:membrane-associated phospholipid phosphatase
MFDEVKRASTLLIFFYIVINQNNQLLVGYIFTYLFNAFLKNAIFKPLMRDTIFPFFGSGLRPPGAKNCGLWSGEGELSYGMPSGHSQLITFFLTSQLLDNSLTWQTKNILILLSLYLLYTRVELGCHTWQQVIVGALFGILSYFLFEKIWYAKNKGTNNKETNQ